MTFSQRAVEAAARAIAETRSAIYVSGSASANYDYDAAVAALTAALAVDGVALVDSPLPPFKVGDRVTHTGRQEFGTVTNTEDGYIVVEFDNQTPSGKKSIGKYDAAWFRMFPRGLLSATSEGEERK